MQSLTSFGELFQVTKSGHTEAGNGQAVEAEKEETWTLFLLSQLASKCASARKQAKNGKYQDQCERNAGSRA